MADGGCFLFDACKNERRVVIDISVG